MLTLNTKLKLQELVDAPNIASMLGQEDLDRIGQSVVEGYALDRRSRTEWEQRNERGVKLALQVVEKKNFPWENCSNVKFPLLTIAALQFLARVSILAKGRQLAKVEVMGADPDGAKSMQAARISKHLSLQLLEEDLNWMDNDEQAKLAASIVGSAFKKTYYDAVQGVTISEYVPAMNFVLDYYCKDINKATRATHLLLMGQNAVQERVRRGLFLPMLEGQEAPQSPETNLLRMGADEAEGLQRPESAADTSYEYEILEQHGWLDLDGDGYAEPYIFFVRRDTAQVLRIVARFFDQGDVHRVNDALVRMRERELRELQEQAKGQDKAQEASPAPAPSAQPLANLEQQSKLEKEIDRLQHAADNHIVRIDPTLHFTRYIFIPSPDGGLYGLGLGALLGPMNESVNTLTNQLIDSGTMSNTAGGFLGRGVKLKGGKTSFDPFEWKVVDSSGDDLRKGIFPLPVREPSTVLFQLLGMLVTYSEKISGATDIMTGVSPGQNTPAETSRNTVEQGMMLFSGIYNRMYRSFKEELRKFFEFSRLYLQHSPKFAELVDGPNAILAKDDYLANAFRIFPAASPESVSSGQRKEKAGVLLQLANTQPGFDRYKVTKNFLEAHDFDGIEEFYPDPAGPKAIAPPPNPKVELEKAKLQAEQQQHQDEMQLAVAQLQQDAALNSAKISELQAKAAEHLANADGVQTGHQIAALDAEIGARKSHQDSVLKALELMRKHAESNSKMQMTQAGGKSNGQSTE